MIGEDLKSAAAVLEKRRLALGRPLTLLATAASTNDEAKLGARAGAPHGATWVAETQTEGRGRQGRGWIAVAGEGLLFSVLLRTECPLGRLPLFALAAGLAVRQAVARAVPEAEVRVKWPNDVVVGTRKVAGILVEATLAGDRVEGVVVGVGINVRTRQFPEELRGRATSIELLGGASRDRGAILVGVLAALAEKIPLVASLGLAPIHAELSKWDALRGERVRGELGEGVADGIEVDGSLRVRGDDGGVGRWVAGEVHLV
jgi:BirA family biotin operon repressor/biotin-[acetyl-CoA-carboxylase] ligase